MRIHRLAVGRSAAVRDPLAAAGAHDGLQRRHKPARRNLKGNRPVAAVMDVRLAIGDGDHLGAGQPILEQPVQGLRRPLHLQAVPLGAVVPELPQQRAHRVRHRQAVGGPRTRLKAAPRVGDGGAHRLGPGAQHAEHARQGEQPDSENDRHDGDDRVEPRPGRALVDEAQVVQDDQVSPRRPHAQRESAYQQSLAAGIDPGKGTALGAVRAGAGDALGHVLRGMLQPPLLAAVAQGREPLVLGQALEERNEIGAGRKGKAGGNLVPDGVEDEAGSQLHIALRPALHHSRGHGRNGQDHQRGAGHGKGRVESERISQIALDRDEDTLDRAKGTGRFHLWNRRTLPLFATPYCGNLGLRVGQEHGADAVCTPPDLLNVATIPRSGRHGAQIVCRGNRMGSYALC